MKLKMDEAGCLEKCENISEEKKSSWRKWLLRAAVVSMCMIVANMLFNGVKEYRQNYSGIPDVVSSISCMGDENLIVVANSKWIVSKEKLARQVIQMCKDNSFQSIKFSTDVNGYPKSLRISVYYQKKDISKHVPAFEIEYLPDDRNGMYDIYHDAEHFTLYVDEKPVEIGDPIEI